MRQKTSRALVGICIFITCLLACYLALSIYTTMQVNKAILQIVDTNPNLTVELAYSFDVLKNEIFIMTIAHTSGAIIIIFSILILIFFLIEFIKKNEALRREKILNAMCNSMEEVYILQNRETDEFVFVSKNSTRILGLSQDNILANPKRSLAKIFPTIFYENKVLKNTNIDEFYYHPVLKTKVILNLEFHVVKLSEKEYYNSFVIKDITENIRQENLLKEALLKAERASKAKGVFLSQMSHEIRTPIQGVIGMNHIAKAKVLANASGSEILDCLNKIEDSSVYLLSLLNGILDMSKIESGEASLDLKYVKISDFINKVSQAVISEINVKKIHFVIDSNYESESFYVDEKKLSQIVVNLLGNAIKFTPQNKKITFTLKEHALKDESDFQIIVADEGIGIEKCFLKDIFKPFCQQSTEISKTYGGNGLGLAITKNFTELLGGRIDVESAVNVGTTFKLYFHFKTEGKMTTKNEEKKLIDISSKHVLIAEDNKINCEIISFILSNAKITFDIAYDGLDALNLYKASKEFTYDFILMDLLMPKMNGYEAIKAIRDTKRNDNNVPIIVLSASTFESDISKCMMLGANGHIAKPIHPDSFVQKISEILTIQDPHNPCNN